MLAMEDVWDVTGSETLANFTSAAIAQPEIENNSSEIGYWHSNAEARGAERQPVRYQSCTESGGPRHDGA